MESEIATLIYELDNLSRSLGLLKDRLQESDDPAATEGEEESTTSGDNTSDRYQQIIVEELAKRRDDIARKVEQAIDEQLVQGGHGLRRFLQPDAELWKALSGPLTDASKRVVLECLKESVCQLMQRPLAAPGSAGAEGLVEIILEGLATIPEGPGGDSVGRILVVPAEVDAAALKERFGSTAKNVTIVSTATCDVSLCTIHKDVPLRGSPPISSAISTCSGNWPPGFTRASTSSGPRSAEANPLPALRPGLLPRNCPQPPPPLSRFPSRYRA